MAGWIRNGNQGNRDPLPALPARGRENEWQGSRDPLPTLPARGREKNALPASGIEKNALPARRRDTSSRGRLFLICGLAAILSACGSSQPAGTVTFQVISDTGPLAHGNAIFAA